LGKKFPLFMSVQSTQVALGNNSNISNKRPQAPATTAMFM
jgi:hypothetical protein